MSRIRFVLVLTLVLLVSSSAFAIGGWKKLYYSDSTFTTVVGGRYQPDYDCPWDDQWWQYGSTSIYRKTFYYTECYEYGDVTEECHYWNGSYWESITCP